MAKISGIDFSAVNSLRETVSIKMFDGKETELPLIPMRYADEGLLLLCRNDTISSRYKVRQSKLKLKAAALKELVEVVDAEEGTYTDKENSLTIVDDTFSNIEVLQKELGELCKESNKLCIEIREYIKPYFKDDNIIEQLENAEDACTVKVLELMLYGADALNDSTDKKAADEENPSTAASLSS